MAIAPTPAPAPEVVIPEVVPAAIRAAGAAADARQAEYIASLAPVDPNAPPVVPVDPQVPVDPNAPPVPPQQPVVVEQPEVTLEGNETDPAKLAHALKSLQGRFKAENARKDKAIADLTSALQERRAAPAPTPAPQPQAIDDTFTPEEIETWGPELTATIARIAEAKAAKALQTVAPVVNQTLESVAIQREMQMREWLNTQIDFEAVNVSDEFKSWLLLRDAMSGAIRQELLNEAWLSTDGPRVLAICNGFLTENPGGTAPQPVTLPPAAPAPQAPRQPQVPMDRLVAPGRAQVQTPVTPGPQKPVYTRADVKAFYDAKNKGFYRGKEAEAAGYEAEIIAAATENRII